MKLLIEYWYAALALLIARIIWEKIKHSARFIGRQGEKEVLSVLRKLNSVQYYIINDITLKSRNGTAQLDHILISDYGVFVIETKNYKGWILGHESSHYWTQIIYHFKNKFYNPVLQVKGHVQVLRNLLSEFPDLKIIPIVVFTENGTLYVETDTQVIYSSKLLQSLQKHEEICLVKRDKKRIFDLIQLANLTSRKTKKQHIKYAKQQRQNFEMKVNNNICPKCGATLVNKEGSYGPFRGCSRFPQCRFTVSD